MKKSAVCLGFETNGTEAVEIEPTLKLEGARRKPEVGSQNLEVGSWETCRTYGDRAFSIAAPRQWNSLPLSIRKSPSIAIFKRHLKTYLFKEAYGF